jgi:Mg-chelatase subunit ChlD
MSSAIMPFKNAPVGITGFYERSSTGYTVHVKATPPADGPQQGQFYTFIFDTSGSMGYDECKVGDDATNYHTRMDLAKMAAELLVRMLGEEDTVLLVGFSDNGSVLLRPTKMTTAGKAAAVDAIKRMRPGGCTNLWNSLEVAHKVMAGPEYTETLKHAIMLTDGDESYPAATHAGGTAEAFASLSRTFTLNVLGFGAAVSPNMLAKLTQVSGGRFSNVADFTTLATTSINALATAMATASADLPVFVTYEDGSVSEHKTSLIQYGQDRNIVFTSTKKPVSVASSRSASVDFAEGLSLEAQCRYDLTKALKQATDSAGRVNGYAAVYAKYAGTAVATHVAEAAADGELVKALADPATWAKWGSKYTWAYLQALENDQRMNFKEKGQAHLGSVAFERYKSVGDITFSAIPKPIATGEPTTRPPQNGQASTPAYGGYGGGSYTAPMVRTVATVANTNDPNAAAGCWAPGSQILLADGKRKGIELLQPGDKVWVRGDGSATVLKTLELGTHLMTQNMCRVGKLLLTWYHPVNVGGVWKNPCDLAPVVPLPVRKVYNCILDSGHVVDIDGTLTVSLGHGLEEPGVKHAFFGSQKAILDACKNQPGYAAGKIVFKDLLPIRDATGLIMGWKEGSV